jgi:hypothetical protein
MSSGVSSVLAARDGVQPLAQRDHCNCIVA